MLFFFLNVTELLSPKILHVQKLDKMSSNKILLNWLGWIPDSSKNVLRCECRKKHKLIHLHLVWSHFDKDHSKDGGKLKICTSNIEKDP